MYLEHFKLSTFPFSLTPNTQFYCKLPTHQEALDVLRVGTENGEGFLKIVGEVGSGKTLLCRKFLNDLESSFYSAYIPNPILTPQELKRALGTELGIKNVTQIEKNSLQEQITEKLLELNKADKKVILIIDEAQALPTETLETLRLFTNLETETSKLIHIILFGQPELDIRLSQPELRQLKQRISFSYHLSLLRREELDAYLCHRMAIAGHTHGSLFTPEAINLLFEGSQGVPRVINILCHKALMVAYGRGERIVSEHSMHKAVVDTENTVMPLKPIPEEIQHATQHPKKKRKWVMLFAGISMVTAIAFGIGLNIGKATMTAQAPSTQEAVSPFGTLKAVFTPLKAS